MSGWTAVVLYGLTAAYLGRSAHAIVYPVTRAGHPWPWRIRWLLWVAAPVIAVATPFVCIALVLIGMAAPVVPGNARWRHPGRHGR